MFVDAKSIHLFILEVFFIDKLTYQVNAEIDDEVVRLLGSDGAQLGIMSADRANALAQEQGLDLVKISPNADPPVCKIMDFSKFCYDQKKRDKEFRRSQRVIDVKEIRMGPRIFSNDFATKVSAAQKFLKDGNRVKITVRFRGREMAHTDIGEKLLMDFAAACSDVAVMDKPSKLEGRSLSMFIAPKNSK